MYQIFNKVQENHWWFQARNNIVKKILSDTYDLSKRQILDIGCGYGYFLDMMKDKGYTNLTGITLSEINAKLARERGHNVKEYDPTFTY